MATVRFEQASKSYGEVEALVDLDLDVRDGEFAVLVGPSGSGKTTALRLLAGLESITSGHVWIGDRKVDALAPRDRDIAMVFQDYALYPQMTVYNNLAFGLRMRKIAKADIEHSVKTAARTLGLEDLLDRRPRELSGGQRQRVALGRALVRQPQVFLMDEPLSNLDAKLRAQTRVEIARIQRDFGVTTVYVTHDQIEAMTLGGRVAVMKEGKLQQFDTPNALYDRPINLFVASFIGSPAMNLTQASLERHEGALEVRFGEHRLEVTPEDSHHRLALEAYVGKKLILGIRPEGIEDAALESDGSQHRRISATIDLREDVGSDVYAYFSGGPPVPGVQVANETEDGNGRPSGAPDTGIFVGRLSPRTRIREGTRTELVVAARSMFFFDADTGLRLGAGSAGPR